MSAVQVRRELIQYIERADDRILRAMYAMLQNYMEEEDIVAFSVEGKPLTKTEMTILLEEAVNDVEKGKGLSSDDIRQAKKNW